MRQHPFPGQRGAPRHFLARPMPGTMATTVLIPPRRRTHRRVAWFIGLVMTALPSACAATPEHSLDVVASAYTSAVAETNGEPFVAAWGDSLEPGMRVIAVSRDLLELGLSRGVRVRIDGLPGEYVVLDKMAKRWSKKIDIYMGEDVGAASR